MELAPKLCYITDRKHFTSFTSFSQFLLKAVQADIDLIQIREKDLDARILAAISADVVRAAPRHSLRVVINDRLDVALSSGAAGVHLGTQSLPLASVRRIAPLGFLAGVSCHSLREACSAEDEGADYILLGPIFETPSKLQYGPPLGLSVLRAVARRVKLPVFALGGINRERIKLCIDSGAGGIAGIRIFQECDSIHQQTRVLRAELDEAFKRRG
jgi:thiamine-phosphate pyrophosphorylase